jgi:hypothetical protein
MEDLLLIALAGFLASLVDGALGMGFGPTSSSILLSAGVSPAAASATVNLAKVVTGTVSGAAHWRFGNVDRQLVRRLAVPGALGALAGTTILVNVDGDDLRPILAVVLGLIGLRILVRFSKPLPMLPDAVDGRPAGADGRGVSIAGAAGGVTNGLVGAWGPVVTPFLLHRGLAPRFAVGSVNTAEVAVAVVSAGSLLGSSGADGLEASIVVAMLAGGAVAAPLAAYVVRWVPPRLLGLAVAGLLLVTQTRELAGALEAGPGRWLAYGLIAVALAVAAAAPRARRAITSGRPTAATAAPAGQ